MPWVSAKQGPPVPDTGSALQHLWDLLSPLFSSIYTFNYTPAQRNIILIEIILILLADGTTVVGFMSHGNQTTAHNIYRQ